MTHNRDVLLGLDIGERRIGVAVGDLTVRLAAPLTTVTVDGSEGEVLGALVRKHDITKLVVGLPRNQAGEQTKQTARVRAAVAFILEPLGVPIVFQDESLTSVQAEAELVNRRKPLKKGDIDAQAAAIILQDYLDIRHA